MINYIRKNIIFTTIITLFFGCFLGYLIFNDSNNAREQTSVKDSSRQIWTCSMHPQIRLNQPGLCPICGMQLILLTQNSAQNETTMNNAVSMSESAVKLANIRTVKVKKGLVQKNIHLFGRVVPDERNISELTARYGGRIEKLQVSFTGQEVRKGQVLGSIYSPELITAQKELLEAAKFRHSNPVLYNAAREKLKQLELSEVQINSIEQRGNPMITFEILSPITGTVTRRHISRGDYVQAGASLFQVIDLSSLWIKFDVYEEDLPWINLNDSIEFTFNALPGEIHRALVAYIDPLINAETRTVAVRININNLKGSIKPEMFVNGWLTTKNVNGLEQILIPKSAVLWTGKRSVVYVKVPDQHVPTYLFREIVLGPETGEHYVVKAGLNEGEEIVYNGVFKIDASAQLAGLPSMMNPAAEHGLNGHEHEGMNMDLSDQSNVPHEETFKVSGNCDMCQNRIEKAVKSLEGVKNASWNPISKIIKITYNTKIIDLTHIHKAIALAGHDTELEKAPEDVYNNLPLCCAYRESGRK
jgi:Cu(I)/Ag(I) efflux system membrane fusion protein